MDALKDRGAYEASDAVLNDEDWAWEFYIGPMLDAIEATIEDQRSEL